MKKFRQFTISIILFKFICFTTLCKSQEGHPEWAGIWGAWGTENYQQSWLKGSLLTVKWKQVEPKDSIFDFSVLETKIQKAVSHGQYFISAIYIENCPEWLFNKGVPKVYINYGGHQKSWEPDYYPYYVNETFKHHLQRMWSAFQKYIANLPTEKKKKFVGFQVPLGRSGDPQPFPGTVADSLAQYNLPWQGNSAVAWTNHQIEMAKSFLDSLKLNGTTINSCHPFFNFTQLAEDIAIEQGLTINRKSGVIAQGYHMNGEMKKQWMTLKSIINSIHSDGSDYIRCRGELDNVVRDESPWFTTAPVWHYYWSCQWMLTYGLDLYMQRVQTLETGDLHKIAFEYFNTHAGYKDAKSARFAYIALRDGLNINDEERFPVNTFGEKETDRFEKILELMAPYGASNDDQNSQSISSTWQYLISRIALNDACKNNWPDNYGKYITQIEPNVHDQGYWRVGSKDEPYGRFARGFDVGNGKNTMYFDVDDAFFEMEANTTKTIRLKITYYGNDTGSWELKYHAADGKMKTAISIDNPKALGQWVTKGVVLTDALLNNGGEKGADLILQNTGSTNCRFHMIELDRETNKTSSDASLLDLKIDGTTIHGFTSDETVYDVVLPINNKKPHVFALPKDAFAKIEINNASEVPGSTIVFVTAEDGLSTEQYTINFNRSTSVAEINSWELKKKYSIYPNPLNKEDLFIESTNQETHYTVHIFNIMGKIISRHDNIKGSYVIPKGLFEKTGVFVIAIDDGNTNTYTKLIVR